MIHTNDVMAVPSVALSIATFIPEGTGIYVLSTNAYEISACPVGQNSITSHPRTLSVSKMPGRQQPKQHRR
jgi:hypothetical protein